MKKKNCQKTFFLKLFWIFFNLGSILGHQISRSIFNGLWRFFWHPWGWINSGDTRVLRFVLIILWQWRRLADFTHLSNWSQMYKKWKYHFSEPQWLNFQTSFNTSYLTDSYINFTLKLESGQNSCSNRSIRSSTYGKKNIFEIPPCGSHFLLIHFTY